MERLECGPGEILYLEANRYGKEYAEYPIKIEVFPDKKQAEKAMAKIMLDQFSGKPDSSAIVSTGNSFLDPYRLFCEAAKETNLDLSRSITFNQDEYVFGSSDYSEHPGSYKSYMVRNLFGPLADGLGERAIKKWHIPDGFSPDPEKAAAEYEKRIRDYIREKGEKIDLAVISTGPKGAEIGHTGFNEPPSERDSITRVVDLRKETVGVNEPILRGLEKEYGWQGPKVDPQKAITIGISTTLDTTKRVAVIRTGKDNAMQIYNMLFGPLGPHNPAGWVRTHPEVTLITDQELWNEIQKIAKTTSPDRLVLNNSGTIYSGIMN